jgi:hypothetical protein
MRVHSMTHIWIVTDTHREMNVISAGAVTLLLTVTSGGSAIHLTREAQQQEPSRGAVPGHYLGDSRELGYDPADVEAARWAETTLCGRPWVLMAGGHRDDEQAHAPSCRRCLGLMDRLFPPPELDDRFPLVVRLVADTILEHGYAEIRSVPGDQQGALRSQVRAEIRRRAGHGSRTYVHESMVIFHCEPIYEQHKAEMEQLALEAMSDLFTGKPPRAVRRPWQLSWDTWATG